MSTATEDTYDPSVKTPAFKFDGKDENWRMFKSKFLSVANKRGWTTVLKTDPYGVIDDDQMRSSTDTAVIAKLKKNDEAMMYLKMSVDCKKAFMYLENTENVYVAWS